MSGIGAKCEVMWGLQIVLQDSHPGGHSEAEENPQTTAEFPSISWFLEEFERKRHKTYAASSYFFLSAMY